jgi:hypothetical protein
MEPAQDVAARVRHVVLDQRVGQAQRRESGLVVQLPGRIIAEEVIEKRPGFAPFGAGMKKWPRIIT